MSTSDPRTDPGAGARFFDDAYRRLLEPFHPEADARYEAGALRELLALAQDDRVLDLGCGWGRHLLLLREAGHDVVGVDLSLALLRQAAAAPDPETRPASGHPDAGGRTGSGSPKLVAGDMLQLPFAPEAFDVVVNLATSLGLFLEDDTALSALREARRVLRPRGCFLLEGMHRADVEAHFAPRDGWTLDDGTEVRAERRWDAERGISHEVLRWDGPMGAGEKRHALRIRSAGEVRALLERAGFDAPALLGDWDGDAFTPESPRLIALADLA